MRSEDKAVFEDIARKIIVFVLYEPVDLAPVFDSEFLC